MDFYFDKNVNVELSNWRTPPYNRWAFSNVCEIVPSSVIQNNPLRVIKIPTSDSNINQFHLDYDGQSLDLEAWINATYGDGLVIIKNGRIICEKYSGETNSRSKHILMSVSKSILGLIAGILSERGELNLSDRVDKVIPEMKQTAYAGSTIQDVLDMRAGILFKENYEATSGPIIKYRKSHLWDPLDDDEKPSDLKSFLKTLVKAEGEHGGKFHYVSTNTDLLGWIIEKETGTRYSTLLSELLWNPIGAEESAYITVDRLGAPRCAGGVCATVRDLAKIGLVISNNGSLEEHKIIPSSWIEDIIENGNKSAWDNGDFYELFSKNNIHYRNQWYVERGSHPMMFAVGVFGQNLFIDIYNNLVIAKVSSQPSALDKKFIDLTYAGVQQIRKIIN